MSPPTSEECRTKFGGPDKSLTDLPDKLFIIFILLSYAPQCVKILKQKSTHGLSPGFIALNVWFNINNLAFKMIEEESRAAVFCANWGGYELNNLVQNLWPVWQYLALLLASMGLLTIYLLFHDPNTSSIRQGSLFVNETARLFAICTFLGLWGAFVLVNASWYMTEHVSNVKFYEFNIAIWQVGLGFFSATLAILQTVPQFRLDYDVKVPNSLSLSWVGMQCLTMLWLSISFLVHNMTAYVRGNPRVWPYFLLFPFSSLALWFWLALLVHGVLLVRKARHGEAARDDEAVSNSDVDERHPLRQSNETTGSGEAAYDSEADERRPLLRGNETNT